MYQWWMAQEQADLWKEENRPLTDFERQRLELIEELDEGRPSVFQRIAAIFRAEGEVPDPFVPHTREEAELVVAGAFADKARSN